MPHYEEPPDDWVCPICKDEGCIGCPGFETYDDEPSELWEQIDDSDGLTREDYAIIEADILLQRDEEMNDAK